jgi:16S rRNA (cytosine1402-N4)-methyltransferase
MGGADELPHAPVLAEEVIAGLLPHNGGRYIDGTVGAGGHASRILYSSGPGGRLIGLDADADALNIARTTLARFGDRAILVEANFNQLERVASANGFIPTDGVILDLGLSSMQLADPARGYSFASETLDMRTNRAAKTTAEDLVNGLDQKELADLIYQYGEERLSRRIARRIVEARPLHSARELAEVIEQAIGRRGRTHPATKTFQALRIAVNHELENLESVLAQLAGVTAPGSRVAFITFHSLEDRRVKEFFKGNREWHTLTKHPTRPNRLEILANPRSRSAKLRMAERV